MASIRMGSAARRRQPTPRGWSGRRSRYFPAPRLAAPGARCECILPNHALRQIRHAHRLQLRRAAAAIRRERRLPLHEARRGRCDAPAFWRDHRVRPRAPVLLRLIRIAAARLNRDPPFRRASKLTRPHSEIAVVVGIPPAHRVHRGIEHVHLAHIGGGRIELPIPSLVERCDLRRRRIGSAGTSRNCPPDSPSARPTAGGCKLCLSEAAYRTYCNVKK